MDNIGKLHQKIGSWAASYKRSVLFILAAMAVYGFFHFGLEESSFLVLGWRIITLFFIAALILSTVKHDEETAAELTKSESEDVIPENGEAAGRELEIIKELSDSSYNLTKDKMGEDFDLFLAKILMIIKKTFAARSSVLLLVDQHSDNVHLKSVVSEEACEPNGFQFPSRLGIIDEIFKSNGPLFLEEDNISNDMLPFYKVQMVTRSIMSAPVLVQGEIIGCLVIDSKERKAFSNEDLHLIETYAGVISEIIVNFNSMFEFENSARLFSTFYEVSRELNSNLAFDKVLDMLQDMIEKVFEFDRLSILQYSPEENRGKILLVSGQVDEFPEGSTFPLNAGLNGSLIRNQKVLRVPDMDRGEFFIPRYSQTETSNYGLRSYLGVPISYHDFCFGAVTIECKRKGAYMERHERILGMLANNFGVALERSYVLEKLEDLATTDGLTGLYNYRSFVQRLHEEIERAQRYDVNFTLLILDLDHFKQVNDTYGHLAGDKVLKAVSLIIKESTRNIDHVARYGGEEYAVILMETDIKNAMISAERIRANVENYIIEYDGTSIKNSISIGAVEYNSGLNYDTKKIINCADQALYEAKAAGRNQVRVFAKHQSFESK